MLKRKPGQDGARTAPDMANKKPRYEAFHKPILSTSNIRLNNNDYTVGWICALSFEMAAAKAMLDKEHPDLLNDLNNNDNNSYIFGEMEGHNVVIACLPAGVYGTTSAATVAGQMLSSFRIRFGLMVGVGGGVPGGKDDIRLGDIVVSQPAKGFGGVLQYDYGKTVQEGRLERTGVLNKPPGQLLTAIAKLQGNHRLETSRIPDFLTEMANRYPTQIANFVSCGQENDQLFEAEYDHSDSTDICTNCDKSRLVARSTRRGNNPLVHYGLVASGNSVMKDGGTRDRLAKELGILCFDMEAAGLMDNFPCLVVRGICDYADSHKNEQWQGYAAATAAAYVKELLSVIPASQVKEMPTVQMVTPEADFDATYDNGTNSSGVGTHRGGDKYITIYDDSDSELASIKDGSRVSPNRDDDRYITIDDDSDSGLGNIEDVSSGNGGSTVEEDSDIEEGINEGGDVGWYDDESGEAESELSSDD